MSKTERDLQAEVAACSRKRDALLLLTKIQAKIVNLPSGNWAEAGDVGHVRQQLLELAVSLSMDARDDGSEIKCQGRLERELGLGNR